MKTDERILDTVIRLPLPIRFAHTCPQVRITAQISGELDDWHLDDIVAS